MSPWHILHFSALYCKTILKLNRQFESQVGDLALLTGNNITENTAQLKF